MTFSFPLPPLLHPLSSGIGPPFLNLTLADENGTIDGTGEIGEFQHPQL